MLPYLVLGIALLAGLLLAGRWFTTTDPKTLVKVLKWLLFGIIGVGALFFILTGRLAWALFALPALLPWFMRARSAHRMYKTFSRMAAGGGEGGNTTLGPLGGRIARRYPLVIVQALLASLAVLMLTLIFTGWIEVWHIFIITLLPA